VLRSQRPNTVADALEGFVLKAKTIVELAGIKAPPVDVAALARVQGIGRIVVRDRLGASGQIRRENGELIIELDSKEPLARRNFSCCHEIAHTFALGDPGQKFREPLSAPTCARYAREEYLCDRAAAELLMPEKLFGPTAAGIEPSMASVVRLARLFQSSIKATIVRIGQLSVWPTVFLVWKFSTRTGSTKKLRVAWSVRPEGARCFVPRNATADANSGMYTTFITSRATAETERLDLGSLRGSFFVENRRFGDQLVSIVHHPKLMSAPRGRA